MLEAVGVQTVHIGDVVEILVHFMLLQTCPYLVRCTTNDISPKSLAGNVGRHFHLPFEHDTVAIAKTVVLITIERSVETRPSWMQACCYTH